METGSGGVCYQNGELVKYNNQVCKVTNKKIADLLGQQKPEVTFTCKEEEKTCDFQCWFSMPLVPPDILADRSPSSLD